MDILSFISKYISSEKVQKLVPLFTLLAQNNFDLKKVIDNLSPETLEPILENVFEQKTSTDESVEVNYSNNLELIKNFASSDIINRLNSYLSN